MSTPVFADSNFWVAITRQRDQYRERAVAWKTWLTANHISLCATSAVLWEWLNLCSGLSIRGFASQGYRGCHQADFIEVVGWNDGEVEAAFELFASHQDKEWSLTDCLSFRVMRSRKLTDALTADHHFVQAGYRALPLEDPPQ